MQCKCIRFAKATTMDEIVSRISLERFNRAFVRNYILLIHVDFNAGQDACRIYKIVSSIQQEMLAERAPTALSRRFSSLNNTTNTSRHHH